MPDYINGEIFMKRERNLKMSLKERDFDVLTSREGELHLMLTGDGESLFLFYLLMPFRDVFELQKKSVWKLRKLATRMNAKPFLATFIPDISTWFFLPLSVLEEKDNFNFILKIRKSRPNGFYLHNLISEELQQRLL